MQGVLAALAHKEQTSVFAVGFAGEATPGTALTGVVRIYLHRDTSSEPGFVGYTGLQLSEGPVARLPIGFLGFG
jgi:hypothetical protein